MNLELSNVTVMFSGLKAIDSVDLRLEEGETLGLIGPNGAGKSTLVNVISGYLKPQTGEVRLGDTVVTGRPAHRLCRMGVTRTFQGVRLFGHLTVTENLEVGALAAGGSRRDARRQVEKLLDEHDLRQHAMTEARSLPYGIERRVALARALAANPRFLLLDEPAAGLDNNETDDLRRIIADIGQTHGCGILVIEHDMGLIARLCDRIQVINSGRTISLGTPDEVLSDPVVREAYLGEEPDTAQDNIVEDNTVEDDGAQR